MRVALASVMQETNTFSVRPTTLEDFITQDIHRGDGLLDAISETNTEIWGAAGVIEKRGAQAVPLLYANAPPGGRLTDDTLSSLVEMLMQEIAAARPLDGMILALHGAMAADNLDDADGMLLERVRTAMGSDFPIVITLDLHANVTASMLEFGDVLTGYHTYPHVDQADTGRRAADVLLDLLQENGRPVTRAVSRPMLLPPETTQTTDGAFGRLRASADSATVGPVIDISFFPSQPWLDVPELGFSALVTTNDDEELAAGLAEEFAELAWKNRREFTPELLSPEVALERARRSPGRPIVMAESADSTSAGATGDSAVMLRYLQERAKDMRALVTIVDPPAVTVCHQAGAGSSVDLRVGGAIDSRFGRSGRLLGEVTAIDNGKFRLSGPVNTALTVSSGRRAAIRSGQIDVLLTEGSAYSYDPAAFRSAGFEPCDYDVVIVRSANMFRAAYEDIAEDIFLLDTPGVSTPRFARLEYRSAPRPLYPLDEI